MVSPRFLLVSSKSFVKVPQSAVKSIDRSRKRLSSLGCGVWSAGCDPAGPDPATLAS